MTEIYNYYKSRNIHTEIMELAGCDLLTISPALLQELQETEGPLVRKLKHGFGEPAEAVPGGEASFRWLMNENAMATEKLAEGIRLEETVRAFL